ncbi:MAG TPA: hypothetical protein ENG56_00875 [Candidatus Aenigmarchaeota archaeon]|nr:hypothetical protein [Candidatus Aenigmarchaeota archaeon]
MKSIVPDVEEERVIDFIDSLITHLERKGLLFDGWQQQRDVRRRVKGEIRLMLLVKFKDKKDRIDDLMEAVFTALEETR